MEFLYWSLGILAFIVVLAVSIGLHEAGHMFVAKMFKLSVPRFFIGFGPTLFSKKTESTEYGVKAIPLGGFVMIEDKTQPDDSPERAMLSHVSPWKRILVFLAGPAVNIVLGTVIIMAVLVSYPVSYVSNEVKSVQECFSSDSSVVCNARLGGMLPGDNVVAINGVDVSGSSEKISENLVGKDSVVVTVDRQGEMVNLDVSVRDNKIGILLHKKERRLGLSESFDMLGTVVGKNVEVLAEIPSKVPALMETVVNKPTTEQIPSSVIVVGKTYGDVSASSSLTGSDKVQTIILYSGLLNLGLGLINILPILPLDGGRIFIAIVDIFRMGFSRLTFRKWEYKPLSMKMINSMTAVAASFVFAFMGLVVLADIMQIIRGQI